jgi:integrase
MAGGRKRKLYRIKAGGAFYVRFQVRGKDIERSTGVTTEAAAKDKGKQIVEAEISGDTDKARTLKLRSDACTLRELCDLYLKNFAQDKRTARTARGNVGALEKVVRIGAGLSLEKARANVLSGELVRKFEAQEQKRIERDKNGFVVQESELRVRTSIGSWLKQARSIFKRSHMSWFDGLSLPELSSFRDQGVRAPERPRPRPLDEGVLAAINAAAPALAKQSPACYVAHLLFSRLGLRNGEIKAARKSWIVDDPRRGKRLGIIFRPEQGFKPKKKTERWIPIAPCVLEEIDKHWALSPDGDFLVSAQTKTERARIVDREHAAWCGQWIKNRTKVSYELRRYAGSLIYRKTSQLAHVQQFLGHANLKTTLDWYWYLLDDVPALDMSDFTA